MTHPRQDKIANRGADLRNTYRNYVEFSGVATGVVRLYNEYNPHWSYRKLAVRSAIRVHDALVKES
ncbi:hypothetical protein GCM10010452_69170 [Crossiella cryophila]